MNLQKLTFVIVAYFKIEFSPLISPNQENEKYNKKDR